MEKGERWGLVPPRKEADVERWAGGGGKAQPLKIQFSDVAKHWTDALPIGNGCLGAMVWGGVDTDILQLNHDTLWTGVPGDYTNPNAPPVLSNVRKLVDSGQYAAASKAAFDLSGQSPDVYQPLGNINLSFGDSQYGYEDYERELDLNAATVNVKYTVGGVEFTREHFCSNPDQVLVTKISANKSGCVSFVVYLDSQLTYHSSAYNETRIIMEGRCPGKRPHGNESGNPSGIRFSSVLDLQIGGEGDKVQVLDGWKLKVDGADWAVLLLAASSSFEGPFTKPSDSKEDPTSVCLKTLSLISNMSYSELLASHLGDYQNLFHRVSLQLSKASGNALEEKRLPFLYQIPVQNNPESDWGVSRWAKPKLMDSSFKPTPERVKSFKDDEDPSLVELLFQYGRYLLISCSRPGTQVANLQGIWNKETEPAWDAAPHLNINLQMNYWPSLSGNLSECQEPLFDFMASLAVNGSKTAKVNYEAGGWVAHQVSDIWAKTSPDNGDPVWALWPMGGAWLCTHLWEHYCFTMDKGFLENKAYPVLVGCASFLLDWLIEGRGVNLAGCASILLNRLIEVRGGYLKTNPSTSPEHNFIAPDGKTASVSYSTTMDMTIIREVFSVVISSAEVLGKSDSDFIKQIKKALLRLPPTKIARDGLIMEWAQDFQDPDVHNRHLSHLFGLFPGHSITVEQTPDLCKAAANSLVKRGDAGPAWSTTWKMALWARLHNSEHAYNLVRQLINLVDPDHEAAFEGGLYGNLFSAHPPFQIDGNFGMTSRDRSTGADRQSEQPPISPASHSAQTSTSSSHAGRTVLALDDYGLFLEQHNVSSRISAIFQSRADSSGYDWHHVSAATREFYFSEFQKRFTWDPAIHDAIRAAWDALAARRYSDMLYRWRRSGERPVHVPEGIWHSWQQVWQSEAWQRRSASASTNRRSERGGRGTGLSLHTAGSISIEEHRRRMSAQEGTDPGEYRLFRAIHTRRDGSWVDTRSQEVGARVEELQSQASQVDSSDGGAPVELSADESRRVFLEAVGAQPRDRRIYGLGTSASRYFPHQGSSSHSSGDISSERLDDMRRSITEEVRQEFQQEFADMRAQMLQRDEQMRQMQDMVRLMSQGSQPPQPSRDRDTADP